SSKRDWSSDVCSSDLYETNDHMLFSFLGWLTVKLPGAPDWLYRLWGILPFLVAVALLTWWLHRKAGQLTAALFLGFATVNSLLRSEERRVGKECSHR